MEGQADSGGAGHDRAASVGEKANKRQNSSHSAPVEGCGSSSLAEDPSGTAAASVIRNHSSASAASLEEEGSGCRLHRSSKRPQDPFLKLFTSAGKHKKKDGEETTSKAGGRNDGSGCRDAASEDSSRGSRSGLLHHHHHRPVCVAAPFIVPAAAAPNVESADTLLLAKRATSPLLVDGLSSQSRQGGEVHPSVPSSRSALLASHSLTSCGSSVASFTESGSYRKDSHPSALYAEASGDWRGGSSRPPMSEWVHAPLECEYHTDMQRRRDAGQLLATPYETLLQQCITAVLVQEIPFSNPPVSSVRSTPLECPTPVTSLMRAKELYTQWRSHRHDGEDIAFASNKHNMDPYLGMVQHRLSIEWRLEKLHEVVYRIREAFEEEQRHHLCLVGGAQSPPRNASLGGGGGGGSSVDPLDACHWRCSNEGSLRPSGSSTPLPSPPPSLCAIAARRTVRHWYCRINLCQLFEDLFVDTLHMAAELPIFMPEALVAYYNNKRKNRNGDSGGGEELNEMSVSTRKAGSDSNSSSSSSLYREFLRLKARTKFLRECPKQMWRAVKLHVEEVLAGLQDCWRKYEALRECTRSFDQLYQRFSGGVGGGGSTAAVTPPTAKGSRGTKPLLKSSPLFASLVTRPPTPREEVKTYSLLEVFEIAGLTNVRSILLFTLQNSANAAAAAAALDSLSYDANPSGSDPDEAEPEGAADADERKKMETLESSEDEEELYSAQNLSPTTFVETESSLAHRDPNNSLLKASLNSNSSNLALGGSMRRVKVVVSSPMLVGMTDSHPADEDGRRAVKPPSAVAGDGTRCRSSSASSNSGSSHLRLRANAAASTASAKREKHVTFVLEPTFMDNGGGSSSGREDEHTTTTAGPRSGYTAPQSAFTWKRYYDEKGEVSNGFARRYRANSAVAAMSATSGDGAKDEDPFLAKQRVLRVQRQRVLQLYFTLDEEDGVRGREGLRSALRLVDKGLRGQLVDIDARVREMKQGGSPAGAGPLRRDSHHTNISSGGAHTDFSEDRYGNKAAGGSPLLRTKQNADGARRGGANVTCPMM